MNVPLPHCKDDNDRVLAPVFVFCTKKIPDAIPVIKKNRLPGDPGASPAQGGGKYRNENESKDSGPNEKGENSSALELARTMGEWDDGMMMRWVPLLVVFLL